LDIDDIAFIYEELHRGGRSVFPPFLVPTQATMTRWDLREPLDLENCVVMDLKDAKRHWETWKESKISDEGKVAWTPESVWGSEAADVVESRKEEVKVWREAIM
jgi:hypothetical protein